MHTKDTQPSGTFSPTADSADTLAAAVERGDLGWTAEQVEADMMEAGFAPDEAAEVIDEAWSVIL
jgi:hypothetical protein